MQEVEKSDRKLEQTSASNAKCDGGSISGVGKRRPGRPAVDRDIRNIILDVAEQLFAEKGYVLTATREIAQQADVRQSMISYYFQSKRALFEAVFKRRAIRLAEQREQCLDELLARTGGKPAVAEVIRAYLAPQFALKRSGPGGMAFVRLQARLHNEPEEFAFQLRREVYDRCVKRYVAVLERLLPHVDPADINWRMVFLVGTYLYMMAGVDRLEDLSDGRFKSADLDELTARMTNFLASGFEAPSTPQEW
ncbi:TetR/AcrR family transcriptional regulator [Massilia orientalis]|uniref:TetR/AcrR family transcriptional regulator n=1 Tax=Massilia orientalis TaxID=3050128 RepID=A0ACC7MKU0_9BURK|nr:TetR/AcrR family transcriptional regulator [Massilia sp. YIM B02787]